MQFSELDLDHRIAQTLNSLGYDEATKIQSKAIPAIQAGEDVLGIAQTGTGKTAAFCLPMIDTLLRNNSRAQTKAPLVLILAPTRELASQINVEIEKFTAQTQLRHGVITGGVSPRPQVRRMQRGVELLVATPGRLLDLATSGDVKLGDVTHFVLDEADQLLDMGFIRDIRKITKLLPEKRQSLLFSATMPKEVEKLAASILVKPQRLQVTPKVVTVKKIQQQFVAVPNKHKQAVLQQLLTSGDIRKAIVFTRTKHGANKVTKKLEQSGVGVEVIHGNKSQNARSRALENFKTGDAWVMVATDVAARGIDIKGISHVINFDVPNDAEAYVHRIGRTARAGASGVAWTLVDGSEKSKVRSIERLTKLPPQWLKVELDEIPSDTDAPAQSEESQNRSRERSHEQSGRKPGRKQTSKPRRRSRNKTNNKSSDRSGSSADNNSGNKFEQQSDNPSGSEPRQRKRRRRNRRRKAPQAA